MDRPIGNPQLPALFLRSSASWWALCSSSSSSTGSPEKAASLALKANDMRVLGNPPIIKNKVGEARYHTDVRPALSTRVGAGDAPPFVLAEHAVLEAQPRGPDG